MKRSLKEVVAEVLQANDILDVLQSWTTLKSVGPDRYKGLCPFHQEKTPSFFVNRSFQAYKCFGCGKHGDAITFIQETEGLTFGETLRKLADKAGIRLGEFSFDGSDDETRLRALEFLKVADAFYRSQLTNPLKGAPGKAYLESRKISAEMVKRFGLGLALESYSALRDHGGERKFSREIMEASGLIKRNETGNTFDMFRNRLMFPIRDHAGRVLAFGGRDLGDSTAKYINSPETQIYKKSRVLYGLFEGRDQLKQTKRAILVEGYFDVLRCFEAGYECAVAPCGTALTPDQATLLARYVEEVVVLFDGDAAGVNAALKAVGILAAAGLSVSAVTIPGGADPDDYIRDHGKDAFTELLKEATDFITFSVRMNAERTATIEGRTAVAREIFAVIADMKDEMRRDEYLKLLARELDVDAWVCRKDFDGYLRDRSRRRALVAESRPDEPALVEVNDHDRQFVALLMHDSTLRQRFHSGMAGVDLSPGPLAEVLEALQLDGPLSLEHLSSQEARHLFASAANTDLSPTVNAMAVVDGWIMSMTRSTLRRETQRLQDEIEQAQCAQDTARLFELVSRKVNLEKEIQRTGAA